jgi:tetraacyldisaccharide 4'-kinase
MTRALGDPVAIDSGGDVAPTRGARVVALAGIARPERFSRALEHAGWTVVATVPFADHHVYTRADLERVARAVCESRADAVLTTEKDAVRLRPWRPLPLPVPIAAVPMTIAFDPSSFDGWVVSRLQECRA